MKTLEITKTQDCSTCAEGAECGLCFASDVCADCCGCGYTYSDFVTVQIIDGVEVEICEGCYKPTSECDREWCI